VHTPRGGFYIFPDFSKHKEALKKRDILTSSQLCEQLLEETGVALLPASAFGFEDNFLAARLAYVDFKEPKELEQFELYKTCPNVVESIEKICSWIEEG
jgi:aspartate aminotransferase